jgi:hypothetical protein
MDHCVPAFSLPESRLSRDWVALHRLTETQPRFSFRSAVSVISGFAFVGLVLKII